MIFKRIRKSTYHCARWFAFNDVAFKTREQIFSRSEKSFNQAFQPRVPAQLAAWGGALREILHPLVAESCAHRFHYV